MTRHLLAATALLLALNAGFSTTAQAQTKTKTTDAKMKTKGKQPMNGTTSGSMTATGSMAGSSAGVMVGGAMMMPDRDIVANAMNSTDHTTLVSAVKAADLVSTLQGAGPYTVFAPTNEAFNKLPAGTVQTLVQPANKQQLTTILTYHVVPGRYLASDLKDGQTLTTVEGETLTVMKNGSAVTLRDSKGGTSTVTIPNVVSSNGVTHVVDTVLMPTR